MSHEQTNAPAADEKSWDGELHVNWIRGSVRRITIAIDGVGTTTVDCADSRDADAAKESATPESAPTGQRPSVEEKA